MDFRFKIQPYQTAAVDSVVDCFEGQVNISGVTYRLDPGKIAMPLETTGFKNSEFTITENSLLAKIQAVQLRQHLPVSNELVASAGCKINLDVEMETGTGKTYCYIKTIFELNKRYGWSKFIIVVPSIAIREGIFSSFQDTAEHFMESFGKKARFFIYNSKQLHLLEGFSSDAGINVMIINTQAFNATGQDQRRIYDELDDFQSRKPIDVISSNRPILILDEPQKMEGARTLDSFSKFKPLMILRYSATHRTTHNKIHRLDALDAFNQKLVKKIAVRGISVKGLAGTSAYLYLESVEVSKQFPQARMEIELKLRGGQIQRKIMRLGKGDNLYDKSGNLDQYRGFVISQIDANRNIVEFTNGHSLSAGEAVNDTSEDTFRRLQIREAIRAHLSKERQLFSLGIKVLSLFFIDSVVKYRDYGQADEKGIYARIFEEEYKALKAEVLGELPLGDKLYRAYLDGISTKQTHNGYFSIDRRTQHLEDPTFRTRGEGAGISDDVDAYDLILKQKKVLLSFEEPVRFIFSHSALREGWDNPNVFVMGMLKHSDNTISRRQEVGRGLRLAVDQRGERVDHPSIVHEINVLTVVAGESYKDFVAGLQSEISDSLSGRPRKANKAFFENKVIETPSGPFTITASLAKQIERYLIKNDYTDDDEQITETYHRAKAEGALVPFPPELVPYTDELFNLVDQVYSDALLPHIDDGRGLRTNPLNGNFDKKEFKELWSRINRKAVYKVEFDSTELVGKCIEALNRELRIQPLQYIVQAGVQRDQATFDDLIAGQGFGTPVTSTETESVSVHTAVKYDLLGKLSEGTHLTRSTLAKVLAGIQLVQFSQYRLNPEHFLSETIRIINEQKATTLIERLTYNSLDDCHDVDIFTQAQAAQQSLDATLQLKNHVFDYIAKGSGVERNFVQELDNSQEVIVYAKLPRGFFIPTPLGEYNPDWAIAFKEGTVKHIYFVAETKGSMSSLQLRLIEKNKIECARKFFDELNRRLDPKKIKYDVVDSFGRLMEIVNTA